MFSAVMEGRSGSFDESGGPRAPRRWPAGALPCTAGLAALVALALPGAALAQTNFHAATNYPAGSNPVAVVADDFNGNLDLDLAVANRSSNNIKVELGDVAGEFVPMGIPDAGDAPSSLAAGDFNGDHDPDLAVANSTSDKVSIVLGGGGYSFLPNDYTFDAGDGPSSVAVADFNSDSHPDLAVADKNSGKVSVLLGQAEPQGVAVSFRARTEVAVGSEPNSVSVGYFDGNSSPDLVVANTGSDSVSVLLGNGSGGFNPASKPTYAAGFRPSSVAVGDFDGDNRADDFAVASAPFDDVWVRRGKNDGTFDDGNTYGVGGEHSSPSSVAVGDLNGDSFDDLAVANSGSNNVAVLMGAPGGYFARATTYAAGAGPHGVAVGDFDNDDDQDLAVANEGSNDVSVLLNNRAPTAAADSYATAQDKPLDVAAPGVLGNDKDPEATGYWGGDELTAAVAAGPEHGTLTFNTNGSFHYDPAAGYTGSDSFQYTVSDGHGGWNVATVTLTVKAPA